LHADLSAIGRKAQVASYRIVILGLVSLLAAQTVKRGYQWTEPAVEKRPLEIRPAKSSMAVDIAYRFYCDDTDR
jgi:hypothetical protein